MKIIRILYVIIVVCTSTIYPAHQSNKNLKSTTQISTKSIPFDIPQQLQIDQQEFLPLNDNETFSAETFQDLITNKHSKNIPYVIARVVTLGGKNNAPVAHYYDAHEWNRYIFLGGYPLQIGSYQNRTDPTNRLPVTRNNVTYFTYTKNAQPQFIYWCSLDDLLQISTGPHQIQNQFLYYAYATIGANAGQQSPEQQYIALLESIINNEESSAQVKVHSLSELSMHYQSTNNTEQFIAIKERILQQPNLEHATRISTLIGLGNAYLSLARKFKRSNPGKAREYLTQSNAAFQRIIDDHDLATSQEERDEASDNIRRNAQIL